jgi:hypothetical protein
VNLFTSKLMKIRWSSLIFGLLASHFQIKLSTHCSNLKSIFVITSELKFFFVDKGLDSKLQYSKP